MDVNKSNELQTNKLNIVMIVPCAKDIEILYPTLTARM